MTPVIEEDGTQGLARNYVDTYLEVEGKFRGLEVLEAEANLKSAWH